MSTEANKNIIRRYYEDFWNRWDAAALAELIAPDIEFRGSLGTVASGAGAFQQYMETVRAAFPDFHNAIEELIAEDDKVVARLTYTGTHRGELFGVAPTGRRIRYAGIAIFRIAGGRIASGCVLGDTRNLLEQLTAPAPGSYAGT